MTTTHACGNSRSCRYIHLKIKRVSSKVTLTRLTIVIALKCRVYHHNDCYCLTSTIFYERGRTDTQTTMFVRSLSTVILITWQVLFTICWEKITGNQRIEFYSNKKTQETHMLGLMTRNNWFWSLGAQMIRILTYCSCLICGNNSS